MVFDRDEIQPTAFPQDSSLQGSDSQTPLVDELILKASRDMSKQKWRGLEDIQPSDEDVRRIEQMLREEEGKLTPEPSNDVNWLARQVLLPEVFWGLLIKFARWTIAESLEKTPEAKCRAFEQLDNVISAACMVARTDSLPNFDTPTKTVLAAKGLKIAGRGRNPESGIRDQPSIVVTDQPLPSSLWSDSDATDLVVLCSTDSQAIPLWLQLRPDQSKYPRPVTCEWPEQVTPDTASQAYLCTLFRIMQKMLVDYQDLSHDRYAVLLPPERLWVDINDPKVATNPGSVLNAMLRYLCNDIMPEILGKCVAWVFAPHPRDSNLLTILAGSEPHPQRRIDAVLKLDNKRRWGLSGRAWFRNRMEISLDAQYDPRVRAADLEQVHQAVAIPLTLGHPNRSSTPWLCKLGVLYVGVQEENAFLNHHHILFLRHFGQLLASYIMKVLCAESVRAGILQDLQVGTADLLEWLNPGRDLYRAGHRSALMEWISSKITDPGNESFPWRPLGYLGANGPTERISCILLRIDQVDELSTPPGSDRDAAKVVNDLKQKVRDWLDEEPFLKELGYDLTDYEHDLLIVLAGLSEVQVEHLCGGLKSWANLIVLNPEERAERGERVTVSTGVMSITYEEAWLMGIRPDRGAKGETQEKRTPDNAISTLRNRLRELKSVMENYQHAADAPVLIVYNRQNAKFEDRTPENDLPPPQAVEKPSTRGHSSQ